ncbi:MAG: FKBP-type peptidyl-prolyl cis-trans isomerase [Treponema sp.]|jgi:FKBP-type peptidyl-prolyl cis-trans isomerase|nr:FKBP-type peptidyl-prolyl cis-trans isomerase [Treponema sp.]
MKKLCVFLLLGALVLFGCPGENAGEKSSGSPAGSSAGSSAGSLDNDVSYALGMDVASSLQRSGLKPDYDSFSQGLKDVLEEEKTRFTQEEAGAKIQEAFIAVMEKQNEGARQEEIDFLAENSKKTGISITASGLQYEVIAEGTGAKPGRDDTVRVNYEGTFTDGTVFDSSYSRGEPAEFSLSGVIPGWTEGIQLMSEGARYRFFIPSELAYGPQGYSSIPPYSPLVFEVELITIVK